MPRPHAPSARGRQGFSRGLKILIAALAAVIVLLVLNAVALDGETGSAHLTTDGARLVDTTAGELQVLDSGPPPARSPGEPILLIHGTGGAIDWWSRVIPRLSGDHRVVAVDLLGHGGSDKPKSGYSIEDQAVAIAQVMHRLGLGPATVAGHSLGAEVAVALAEGSSELVSRLVVIDEAPDSGYGGLGGSAKAVRVPLLGQALWRLAPDSLIERGLRQAFAPGFEIPDAFVDDLRQMTYTAYSDTASEATAYTDERPLNSRIHALGLPLLVIFGSEDQIFDPRESISAYAAIPGVETALIQGAGHSPQVEAPAEVADLIGRFATPPRAQARPKPGSRAPAPQKSGSRRSSGSHERTGTGPRLRQGRGSGKRPGAGSDRGSGSQK